jgi:hypothetical protein
MKEFKCHKCSVYLGEMSNGKFKKDAVVLCGKCHDMYKLLYDLKNYDKSSGNYDMPDFMKDIFKKGQ